MNAPQLQRPWLVLMLGAPGSGKTTLGTDLARALRVPFLARDDVRTGLWFSAGAWSSRPGPVPAADEAVEAFLTLVESMAGLGVSCVVEYVFRSARPEDLARVMDVAACIGIRTWCDDAPARHVAREQDDRLIRREAVLDALGDSSLEAHIEESASRMDAVTAEMRADFDFPVLEVDTNAGYAPSLDEIVDFVVLTAARP